MTAVLSTTRAWSFVVVRGRSWSFVVVRGRAWSCAVVVVRGRAPSRPTVRSQRHGGYFFSHQEVDEQLDYPLGTLQVAVKRKPAVNFIIVFRRMLVQRGKFCVISMLMKGSAEQ